MKENNNVFEITKEKVESASKIGLINKKMVKVLEAFTKPPELYVPVAARIKYFREEYMDWSIETEVAHENGMNIAVSRCIIRDTEGRVRSTGTSSKAWSDVASHTEFSETAAVGRALGNLGILGGASIASMEEVNVPEVQVNSVDDAPRPPSEENGAPHGPESKVEPPEKVITRKDILDKVTFFKIPKDKFNERTVSKKHTFIIRDHDKLAEKVRTAFDNLGFKITKGVYKLRIDQVEGDK